MTGHLSLALARFWRCMAARHAHAVHFLYFLYFAEFEFLSARQILTSYDIVTVCYAQVLNVMRRLKQILRNSNSKLRRP